jgi:plasmid stability protein
MSVSLTISNLDDETFRRLQAEAQRTGSDPISVAKSVLARNLPAAPVATPEMPAGPPYHDLDFMFGTWTEEEAKQFLDILSEQRQIDPELWQ